MHTPPRAGWALLIGVLGLGACGPSGAGGSSSGSSASASAIAGSSTSGSTLAGGRTSTADSTSGSARSSTASSSGTSIGGSLGSASGGTSSAAASAASSSTGGRTFPDTTASIAVLTDQLPGGLTPAQQQFAATHYVGTEKQLLPDTRALRAYNPTFLVLHYHLAMWESAVDFIDDGVSWGNDLPTVTTHESWFWHTADDQTSTGRVTAPDGKFLMQVTDPDFAAYWAQSLAQQVADGEYDGIMFDSASPSLLQAWCGGAGVGQDPRLAGTAAADTPFTELGGATWIGAWQTWISALGSALSAQGIPLIPNDGAFITGWDHTDYALTAGAFSEGFADPTFALSDWQSATDELLGLAAADKLLILQNYLSSADDVATRMYYLGNYLLVKGSHTYLDYFDSSGPLEWFPEWGLDLGAPTATGAQVSDLSSGGVYRRDFANGVVLVNPSPSPVTVPLEQTYQQVVPSGGGPIDASGDVPGSVSMVPTSSVTLAAASAAVLLR